MATILITAINIVAGMVIGTLQQGIGTGEAVKTYTILTVGDGLVTLIPCLLVSIAGGIMLTRATRLPAGNGDTAAAVCTAYHALDCVRGMLAMCLIPGFQVWRFF